MQLLVQIGWTMTEPCAMDCWYVAQADLLSPYWQTVRDLMLAGF